MTEAVACNNELRRLITENENENCCVMIWAITWATMLAKVWESMRGYIDEKGTDWSEGRVILEL